VDLSSLQRTWDTLGELDPMWAIITEDPNKLGGRWDADEFFATGRAEIDELLAALDRVGLPVARGSALDFGCGVGRLARALSAHFAHVAGVDIAPSMIAKAEALNADRSNCEWRVNAASDLHAFADGTFDLIYSNIVLQHMRPTFALAYLREFVRLAKPGGAIVFQLPERTRNVKQWIVVGAIAALWRVVPKPLLTWYRRRHYPNASEQLIAKLPRRMMEMHGIRRGVVERVLREAGATVVHVDETKAAGEEYVSLRYFVTKGARR
jgi:2-polyprenyl-3-methyl-5-hydroxy-6-metoxy-1,4-benzoquinol methylase